MTDLIARLEAAPGPDRELDGLIAYQLGLLVPHFDIDPSSPDFKDWSLMGGHWVPLSVCQSPVRWNNCCCKTDAHFTEPLHYTASIDAALTLVPEGWEWRLNVGKTGCVVCLCPAWNDDYAPVFWSNREDKSERGKLSPYRRRIGSSPTPALALCIAALKARKESE